MLKPREWSGRRVLARTTTPQRCSAGLSIGRAFRAEPVRTSSRLRSPDAADAPRLTVVACCTGGRARRAAHRTDECRAARTRRGVPEGEPRRGRTDAGGGGPTPAAVRARKRRGGRAGGRRQGCARPCAQTGPRPSQKRTARLTRKPACRARHVARRGVRWACASGWSANTATTSPTATTRARTHARSRWLVASRRPVASSSRWNVQVVTSRYTLHVVRCALPVVRRALHPARGELERCALHRPFDGGFIADDFMIVLVGCASGSDTYRLYLTTAGLTRTGAGRPVS